VLKYIEWGENVETRIKGGRMGGSTVKGYHNLSTVKSRKIWYSLGERDPAPLLFSCKIWERPIFSLNNAKAQADKSFYEVHPDSKGDITLLAGTLNSVVTALLLELHGRFYGGGVLELEVYESKKLPVLNPEELSESERKRIEIAFIRLCDAQRKQNGKKEKKAKKELDDAVFDALGLSKDERKQVYEGLRALRDMRLRRKKVDVLVETEEKWKPPKRHGKRRSVLEEPYKRLDLWMRE